MQPKHWYALLLIFLIPVFVFAQAGKIRGKVVDETTKEPLIGANIVVEGTSMGAATDVNGEYLIINVAAGEYTIKASYVGYRTVTIAGVRVNLGLTVEQNFALPGEGVAVPTVQITAERPLINKSATSAVRIVNQSDFEKLPARGINAVIALQPGIVTIGGNFYARGSRSEDMSFSLEGASINDPVNGGRAISLIQESLEEVQVLVGGYTAEFGGSNGALVRSQLRTGGERWRFTLMGETDHLAGVGSKFLGRYNSNSSESVVTGGGPVTDNVRLFLSGRYGHTGPGGNTWQEPFDFGKVVTLSQVEPSHPTSLRRDTIAFAGFGGTRGEGYSNDYQGAGTVKFDFKTTQIQLGGTFRYNAYKNNRGWTQMNLNPRLTGEGTAYDGLGTLKLTQFLDENTLFDVTFSYQGTGYENYDPDFKDNFWLYGDSAANYNRGVKMRGDNYTYSYYQIAFGPQTNLVGPGMPTIAPDSTGFFPGYSKGQRNGYGLRANFSTQLSKTVELKAGGEYQTYTHRRYTPASLFAWAQWRNYYAYRDASGNITAYADPNNPADSLGRTIRYLIRSSYPNNLGYDMFGNKIDNDVVLNDPNGSIVESSAPMQPKFFGAYVQSKIELKDIVMNIGVRYDYFNSDCLDLVNRSSITFNDSLAHVATTSNFIKARPLDYLQPRLGFSFPVTDKTVFHATFGKFVELLRLADMSNTAASLSNILRGGFFYTTTVAFGIAPQRSTQYEVGFAQQIGDIGSIDLTAFYKDITDQLQYTMYFPAIGAENGAYPLYVNQDFSTNKGLELKFTLRRTNRVSANINYTLSDAKTTGSSQTQTNGIWGGGFGSSGPFLPRYVQPSTFNQTHTGVVQLDYRFGKNDGGPVLEQLGANFLFRFGSGFNWTRLYSPSGNFGDVRGRYPLEEVGASTTPWNFRLDGRLDKTIDLGPVSANIYMYVTNILNSKIPYGVKVRTGDVFNDGFLQTADGKAQQAAFGADGTRWAQYYDYFQNSVFTGNIDSPRNIRVGLQLQF